MFIETWITWIANHIGSTFFKNWSGVRKDFVDTKKAKLEINKLEDEAEKRESLITPATLEDVKNYDPKYKQIRTNIYKDHIERADRKLMEAMKGIFLVVFIIAEIYIHVTAFIQLIVEYIQK